MQNSEANRLQEEWERKGNPPCDHPTIDKEYYLGSATGDYVCTVCGKSGSRDGLKRDN